MHVIGTAGHVDHGKSALVQALTGVHPDRLKEEREREMTIDLGFAWFTMPGEDDVGIVDVPGHRDFIENMLAGVGGIDAVILVVAADEGVMPQTREHLAILDLLQVQSGLVALTKIDLIDDMEWLDLVESDVRNALIGTSLENVNIYRVSSKTKEGIDALVSGLESLLSEYPLHADLGKPRLPIDRIFSISGFGTVVTGTLQNGSFKIGDEVEILPSGVKGRIRGLQNHQRKVDIVFPGSRTAINISGVDVNQIARGEVVAKPSTYKSTRLLDVSFRLLTDASQPIKHDHGVKLFIGASETPARVRLLGAENLNPGEEGWLQLETDQPIVAVRGDRFILRRPSPGETIGGGMVVDALPKRRHKRFAKPVIDKLNALAQGSPEEILLQAVLEVGAGTIGDILARANLNQETAKQALSQLLQNGELIDPEKRREKSAALVKDNLATTLAYWETLLLQIMDEVSHFHQVNPLKQGMPREALRSRTKISLRLFNAAIDELLACQKLAEIGVNLKSADFSVKFNAQQQAAIDGLLAKFKSNPYLTPSVKDCQNEVGELVYSALVDQEALVQVSPEVVFLPETYINMVEDIKNLIQSKGSISAAGVRDHFNTSRKYALALLENMDAQGITVRRGDERQLKG
ncbi:MAG: selenocysteine-specific translation elongation factor [Anaerolineales bacterium]|nr:selenocysteine-specific translation elongation factor [Anaerolineales bacterium]